MGLGIKAENKGRRTSKLSSAEDDPAHTSRSISRIRLKGERRKDSHVNLVVLGQGEKGVPGVAVDDMARCERRGRKRSATSSKVTPPPFPRFPQKNPLGRLTDIETLFSEGLSLLLEVLHGVGTDKQRSVQEGSV